ncbi:MAG: hypothetical protein ABI388_07010 [Bacteroidia bacterium]
MKTKKITIVIASLMIASSLTLSAQQADKKATSARKNIAKDEHKLSEAKKDSASNYQNFKIAEELKIVKNEKSIAELKAKKTNDDKNIQETYDKNVSDLEQKNNNLRDKLSQYNTSDKSIWLSFKHDYTISMEQLEKEISKLK